LVAVAGVAVLAGCVVAESLDVLAVGCVASVVAGAASVAGVVEGG